MFNLFFVFIVVGLNSWAASLALKRLLPKLKANKFLAKYSLESIVQKLRKKFFGDEEQGGLLFTYDVADFADYMIICLGAGHTIPGAFSEAGSNVSMRQLQTDVNAVLRYYNMGCSFAEALHFARNDSPREPFRNLVDTLLVGIKMGTDLSEALEMMCQNLRKSASCQIEESAARAPVKMLFPMVAFIFPAIFILLGAPVIRDIIDALQ